MTQSPLNASEEITPYPKRWTALATVLIAGFMNLLDVTIVNVALPSLQVKLGAGAAEIEWVTAGYVLAFALGLLPFGRLGDIYGRKRMFMVGVGAFSLTSLLCGAAPSIEVLIAARVLQGFSGALMMPQVMAIMHNIFPPQERARAFSFFGLVTGLAAVTGPVLGGVLIGADLAGLSWRPIFLINLPIGIYALITGARLIPEILGDAKLKNDWGGIVIFGLAVFLLVFPLIEGRGLGWPVWSIAMIVISVPAFWVFVLWQRRQEGRSGAQLLPLTLLGNFEYMMGVLAAMTLFSAMPGFFLVFALFLQQGFGLTPLQSGLTTIPFPVGILIASLLSNRMGNLWLTSRMIGGLVLIICGMVLVRLTILSSGEAVSQARFIGPLMLCGFGTGTTIAVLFQSVLATVPPRDAGSGSGALQAFQQIGGALGIALTGGIFFSGMEAAGSSAGTAAFVQSTGRALLYPIAAYFIVLAVVLVLKWGGRSDPARS